MLQISKN